MRKKLLIKLFIYNVIFFTNLIMISYSSLDYNKRKKKNVSWFIKLIQTFEKNNIPHVLNYIEEKPHTENIIKYNEDLYIIFFKNDNIVFIKNSFLDFLSKYNFNRISFNFFKNIFLKLVLSYKIDNDNEKINTSVFNG